MLGSWYTPREIGKRSMIFWLAGSVGNMFSGFLQAAAYKNLSGVHGHAGWRWLFIIDGIITIPLALMGYIFFPNLPQDGKKTWWTTKEEHILAIERMRAVGRAGKQPWTKAKAKSIFLSWHTYLLRKASYWRLLSLTDLCKRYFTSSGTTAALKQAWGTG
jgi:ACS family pantothenate transporter-like MFS transporter